MAEFTETGQVTYLADLQEGRYSHACSKFVDDAGETVSFRSIVNLVNSYSYSKYYCDRLCL